MATCWLDCFGRRFDHRRIIPFRTQTNQCSRAACENRTIMPASKHTKLANTKKRASLWRRVFLFEKPRIGKVRAIRAADSSLRRAVKRRKI